MMFDTHCNLPDICCPIHGLLKVKSQCAQGHSFELLKGLSRVYLTDSVNQALYRNLKESIRYLILYCVGVETSKYDFIDHCLSWNSQLFPPRAKPMYIMKEFAKRASNGYFDNDDFICFCFLTACLLRSSVMDGEDHTGSILETYSDLLQNNEATSIALTLLCLSQLQNIKTLSEGLTFLSSWASLLPTKLNFIKMSLISSILSYLLKAKAQSQDSEAAIAATLNERNSLNTIEWLEVVDAYFSNTSLPFSVELLNHVIQDAVFNDSGLTKLRIRGAEIYGKILARSPYEESWLFTHLLGLLKKQESLKLAKSSTSWQIIQVVSVSLIYFIANLQQPDVLTSETWILIVRAMFSYMFTFSFQEHLTLEQRELLIEQSLCIVYELSFLRNISFASVFWQKCFDEILLPCLSPIHSFKIRRFSKSLCLEIYGRHLLSTNSIWVLEELDESIFSRERIWRTCQYLTEAQRKIVLNYSFRRLLQLESLKSSQLAYTFIQDLLKVDSNLVIPEIAKLSAGCIGSFFAIHLSSSFEQWVAISILKNGPCRKPSDKDSTACQLALALVQNDDRLDASHLCELEKILVEEHPDCFWAARALCYGYHKGIILPSRAALSPETINLVRKMTIFEVPTKGTALMLRELGIVLRKRMEKDEIERCSSNLVNIVIPSMKIYPASYYSRLILVALMHHRTNKSSKAQRDLLLQIHFCPQERIRRGLYVILSKNMEDFEACIQEDHLLLIHDSITREAPLEEDTEIISSAIQALNSLDYDDCQSVIENVCCTFFAHACEGFKECLIDKLAESPCAIKALDALGHRKARNEKELQIKLTAYYLLHKTNEASYATTFDIEEGEFDLLEWSGIYIKNYKFKNWMIETFGSRLPQAAYKDVSTFNYERKLLDSLLHLSGKQT